jgi:UDP-N-acetylmuramoyl-tripeptide--D-alanyl-D-alanine ligase
MPEQGRQLVLQAPAGFTVVDDAYNANPDSMRASLAMFSSMVVAGRRVAVLGDMGELGSFSEEGHRLVGAAAAGAGLHALVCVGRTARLIADSAREAGFPAHAITQVETAHDACELVPGMLKPGDAVLVKASHSMELNRVVEELMR